MISNSSRMIKHFCNLFIPISILISSKLQAQNSFELWYRNPASEWTEALPVGNGRLAAMVFGKTDMERIQLNEESIWAGCNVYDINPGTKSHLREIQQLLLNEKNDEAYELTKKYMLGVPPQIRSYQTLGDLFIDWGNNKADNYRRLLDLQTAICSMQFTSNGVG